MVKPYPGAFFYYKGNKIIVDKASLLPEEIRGVPGRISFFRGENMVVIARDRGILVEEISIDGEAQDIKPRSYFRTLGEDLS